MHDPTARLFHTRVIWASTEIIFHQLTFFEHFLHAGPCRWGTKRMFTDSEGKTDMFTKKCPFNKRQILMNGTRKLPSALGPAEEAITSCQGARKGLRGDLAISMELFKGWLAFPNR